MRESFVQEGTFCFLGNGVVSYGEFKEFYANFVGIASDDLDRVSDFLKVENIQFWL